MSQRRRGLPEASGRLRPEGELLVEDLLLLALRYGLVDGRAWSVADVARACKTTRATVRLIEARAMGRLKAFARA